MLTSPPPHSDKELNWLHVSGRYAQLIDADRENLAHLLRVYGSDHKYVGVAISRLAWSLYENGDFAAAENELLQGMIADVADRDDLKERNVAFLDDLANIYLATRRDQDANEAVEYADELMASMNAVPPVRRAISLSYSARILKSRGELSDAERLLREAADLVTNESGPKNRTLGIFLHRLSEVYAAQGRMPEAVDTMQKALDVYPARETAYYANSISILGMYLAKQGNVTDARSYQTKALDILKRVRPAGHRDIVAAEHRLAGIQGPEDTAGSPS